MKIVKRFIVACIVFVSCGVAIADAFNNIEEANNLSKKLMLIGGDYLLDKNKNIINRSDDLNKLIGSLDVAIEKDSSNPVYWVLRGLAQRNFIIINRKFKWKILSGKEYLTNPELLLIMEKSEHDFQKAIELDKIPDASMHLTYDMLAAVYTRDTLLSAETTELYTKRRLDAYPSNNRQIVENNYNAMYAAYVKENRFDDAERIINDMEKALARFYTAQQLQDFISQYRSAIENVRHEAEVAEQKKKQVVTESPSAAPEVVQQQNQLPKSAPMDKPVQGVSDNRLWYLLLGILIFLVVVVILVRGRRHKS